MEGLFDDDANCQHLTGKILCLFPFLPQKKFRKRYNKDGDVRAFYHLETYRVGFGGGA